jgi:hypothetical protein
LQHRGHTELLGDGSRVLVLAFERERRGTRDHPEPGHVSEPVEHLHGEAVGEIRLLRVAAQVLERQDSDRRVRRRLWFTNVGLPHEQHSDGDEQHADDREVCKTALTVHARPRGVFGRRIALQAVIAHFVEPRQRHGDWEAQDGGDDERSHDPLRHTERVKR